MKTPVYIKVRNQVSGEIVAAARSYLEVFSHGMAQVETVHGARSIIVTDHRGLDLVRKQLGFLLKGDASSC